MAQRSLDPTVPIRTTGSDAGVPETTDDAFLGGKLHILQPAHGYRAGIDAVLLAATVPDKPGPPQRILDVGSGVGTVGLCVAARIESAHITLVERDPHLAEIARQNIERNNLRERVNIVTASVTGPACEHEAAGHKSDSFDFVLANPPFHTSGRGTPARTPLKAASHAMDEHELNLWLRFLTRVAKPGGIATIIHKIEALDQLLAGLHQRFGNLRILPVHPRATAPAHRVIITGIKGSKADLSLSPGLILHDQSNDFTSTVSKIVRDGAPLAPDA